MTFQGSVNNWAREYEFIETELSKARADLGEALGYIAGCYDPDKKAVLFEQGKDILKKHGRIK
jgi:hypothetical protein